MALSTTMGGGGASFWGGSSAHGVRPFVGEAARDAGEAARLDGAEVAGEVLVPAGAAFGVSVVAFFFLRLRGGLFFFAGVAATSSNGAASPSLLDAHSETDSASSSTEFQ